MQIKNIIDNSYTEIKSAYDVDFNVDQSSFHTSNDEPTPIGCVEEMLDVLPTEFWKQENATIFDPSCGNGNFHLVAWNKLKTIGGFGDKHIVENMLYFNDLNNQRLEKVKKVFRGDLYKLNILKKDFLKFGSPPKLTDFIYLPNEPKIGPHHLVHTNPPFALFTSDGKRAAKNHTMVRDFIQKSFEWVLDGQYLIFIVPDNWMSLADRNDVVKILTKNQFRWLNIHGAKKWFPKIGSSFTWFVIQKLPAKDSFVVDCIYKGKQYKSTVNSDDRPYIPLLYNDLINSILKKTIDKNNLKFKIETTSYLHKFTKKNFIREEKDENYKYKLIHTPHQIVWSSIPHKYQNGYKVFISTTDKYTIFIDKDCGMTQSIAFILCKNKKVAEQTEKILNHNLYRFLNDICRWGNFNNIRILQKFPIPLNENDIYKSFELNDKEIFFIEKILN